MHQPPILLIPRGAFSLADGVPLLGKSRRWARSASALPFFILALPAGAIGDIVDRRKVILFTEIWMLVVAEAGAGR